MDAPQRWSKRTTLYVCDVAMCYTSFDWLVESAMFAELSFWVRDDTAYFTKHRYIATQHVHSLVYIHGVLVFCERQNNDGREQNADTQPKFILIKYVAGINCNIEWLY